MSAKFSILTSSSHNISNGLTKEHKLIVDKHLAKLFILEGRICSKVLQSSFSNDFVKDIAEYGHGYEVPSLLTLESQLIHIVSKEVTEYVENVKRSSDNTGCTLICNQWLYRNNISGDYNQRTDIFLYTSEGVACLESYNQKPNCLDTAEILSPISESLEPKNVVQIFLCMEDDYIKMILRRCFLKSILGYVSLIVLQMSLKFLCVRAYLIILP